MPEMSEVDDLAGALASAHGRWMELYHIKRELTQDEYRWFAVAAERYLRKRRLKERSA